MKLENRIKFNCLAEREFWKPRKHLQNLEQLLAIKPITDIMTSNQQGQTNAYLRCHPVWGADERFPLVDGCCDLCRDSEISQLHVTTLRQQYVCSLQKKTIKNHCGFKYLPTILSLFKANKFATVQLIMFEIFHSRCWKLGL